MKRKISLTACTLLLAALLGACASTPQVTGTAPSAPDEPEASETIQAETPPVFGGNALGDDGDRIVVMDTMMYRGEVSGLQDAGDGFFMHLTQVAGTNYSYPSLAAVTDGNTDANFDLDTLEDGMYIEVFYKEAMDGNPVTILAANLLPDADLCVYNGTVTGVETLDAETIRVELNGMDGGDAAVFQIGAETNVYMDAALIVEGAALNIFHSGAMTRSMPPQGYALEVRPYSA